MTGSIIEEHHRYYKTPDEQSAALVHKLDYVSSHAFVPSHHFTINRSARITLLTFMTCHKTSVLKAFLLLYLHAYAYIYKRL